jgi:hypothetical protein
MSPGSVGEGENDLDVVGAGGQSVGESVEHVHFQTPLDAEQGGEQADGADCRNRSPKQRP